MHAATVPVDCVETVTAHQRSALLPAQTQQKSHNIGQIRLGNGVSVEHGHDHGWVAFVDKGVGLHDALLQVGGQFNVEACLLGKLQRLAANRGMMGRKATYFIHILEKP